MTLETIRVYPTRGDAEIAAALLRGEGIESLVVADDEGGLNPGFYRTYGVRLVVAGEQAAVARELLGVEEVLVHPEMVAAMRQHARFCAPEEACGLIATDAARRPRMVYCCTNVDRSPHRFTVSPDEHFHAMRHAEALGWEIGGVFHSHPNGPASPSLTDLERAPDPTWWYLIVGGDGTVRAYLLGDAVEEVPMRLIGMLAGHG